MFKSSKLYKVLFNWSMLIIVFVIIILINVISSLAYWRFDMTEDQRYSLAPSTEKFLENKENFDSRISIQIYLDGKNLPAEIRNFQNSLKDKIKEFKAIAEDRIEYVFIAPDNGSEEDIREMEIQLYDRARGIIPMELIYNKNGETRQVRLWPGAKMTYSSNGIVKEQVIQFLPGSRPQNPYQLETMGQLIENALNNLEYNLVSNMRKLIQTEKKRVAFLHGHGELNPNQTLRARYLIAPYFAIADVTLNDSVASLNDVDGLIIADPKTPFSDKDLYLIDQFLMRGGKLMCFLNTLHLEEDSLMARGVTHTTRKNLRLENMLFDYGIKVNENYVVDVRCAPKVVPMVNQSYIPWFFHLLATPGVHPIAKNVEPVSLKYCNELQFVKQDNLALTPILTTSSNSNKTGLAPLVSLSFPMNYDKKNPVLIQNPEDDINKMCVAGLAEGEFKSHFVNRLAPEFVNNPNSNFLSESKTASKVFVVGNGSFIANRYDSIPDPKGKGFLYRPDMINDLRTDHDMAIRQVPIFFGNQEFFQNAVDYMMGDLSVLDIRSRQIDIKEIDKEKVKQYAGFYKAINFLLPVGGILLMGLIINRLRFRKYGRK
ncbi:MAG: hypothetical protein RL264_2260 [Bacteroidota bacterium]